MSNSKDKTGQKIQRFAQMVRDLRAGKNFNITRLTTIKSLAEEPKTANRFVLYLAEKANELIQKSGRPKGMKKANWEQGQKLAGKAIEEMRIYVNRRSKSRETTLRKLRTGIRKLQNEQKPIPYGVARIVHSNQLLIVEKALECCVSPHHCDRWAYQVARDYAERYSSKYPNGLTPTSAPFVKDIAEFWCREHFGESLEEQFGDE